MVAKRGIGIWDTGPAKPKPKAKPGGTRVSIGPFDVVGKRPTAKKAAPKRGRVGTPNPRVR